MKNPLLITALSLTLLASCGGETVTKRSIHNNTDKEVNMVLYRFGNPGDTLNFAPDQKRDISVTTSNKGSDEEPDCVFDIDSAWVGIEGGGKFTKRIEDNNNWTSESEREKIAPPTYANTCVFHIYLSDFE